MKPALIVLLAASALTAPASAAVITGLFNTGTDASNVALVGGNGITDPHYTILSSTSPGFAGQQAQTYFNGAYVANDANSRWISLTGNGTPVNNTTVYRLTFDLTGFDPLTAFISGRAGTDNSGNVKLNGGAAQTIDGFGSLTAFSFNSGFVAGINTLDFTVADVGVVTALRVDDLAGRADLAIPEPESWALMILGFAMLGSAVRVRTKKVIFA